MPASFNLPCQSLGVGGTRKGMTLHLVTALAEEGDNWKHLLTMLFTCAESFSLKENQMVHLHV